MGSKRITLSEFAVHQKGFAFKSNDYQDSGVAVVRVSNFTNDSIDINDLKFVSADVANDKTAFELLEDDVVIATVGSWPNNPASVVGKVIRVPANASESLLNQNAVRLRPISNDANDLQFLFYLLKDKTFSDYIVSTAQGSANQASITLKDIYAYEFDCPDYQSRTLIAKNLYALDKKITLNRQINQTLEQMAQTLFKSWFVDFDPVIDNALDAGNDIPDTLQERAELCQKVRASQDFQPLPADIRALFPAEFEESELGWVPKGWEVDSLNSVASYTSGRVDISELNLNNYISTENMLSDRQGVCSASSLPTVQTVPSYSMGHILISNIRPYFKKIWFAHGTGGRSNDVLGFSANQAGTEDYLYNLLYQDVFFDFMMTTSKGSKMPRGDKDAIMDWPLVIPSMELRRFYSLKCKASRSFGEMHRNENRTLEQLRDTLLPKLISGELRLDEIPSP